MSSDYGTYRLTYTPPASDGNEYYPAISIEMSTGGDANVEQMLRFYEAFLAASGYILKGDLQIVKAEEAFDKDYWQKKYFDLLNSVPESSDYPKFATQKGTQAVDFVPFSSIGEDIISWGPSNPEE